MAYIITAILAYGGLHVLSSRLPLHRKLALNSVLGLFALYILTVWGKLSVYMNLFTAAALSFCGPAGLVPILTAQTFMGR